MKKLIIERKSSDNKYLHRDFFVSGDIGISYVGNKYGDQAVVEYLIQYTKNYYSKLAERVLEKGFVELENYFKEIFEKEERLEFLRTKSEKDKLTITIEKCPAVTYMKSVGHQPSKWYRETTYTVYGELAKMCGFNFKVEYYNEQDGSSKFCFFK